MSRITLSFDNGPTPDVTPHVLEALSSRDLSAYFCVVGRQLQKGQDQVDIARETLGRGHKLVNHSLTHGVALGDDPSSTHARAEVTEMHSLMADTIGSWGDAWFRPFGRGGEIGPHIFSEAAVQELGSHDYSVLLWNSVPRDWEQPKNWVDQALEDISQQDHTVVVLHDLPTGAMLELPRFLDAVLEAGHEVTLDLPDDCVPMRSGAIAWSSISDLVAKAY